MCAIVHRDFYYYSTVQDCGKNFRAKTVTIPGMCPFQAKSKYPISTYHQIDESVVSMKNVNN